MAIDDLAQLRRDSAADWDTADPTLSAGEPGYESDTGLLKIGDAATAWTSLAYLIGMGEVQAKTANYTMVATDIGILGDATSGNITVTLKTAASMAGRTVWVKKKDSSSNTVTIDANGSETIDGATTKVLSSQYDGYKLYSDGTEWWIVGAF